MPSSPTSGTEIVLDVLGGEVVHGRGGDDAVQQNRHQYHEGEERPQLVGGHADAGTAQRVREDTVWTGPEHALGADRAQWTICHRACHRKLVATVHPVLPDSGVVSLICGGPRDV